jgi:Fe-S oxidoreductase
MIAIEELKYELEKCRVCGECLSHCPVFGFTKGEAAGEMEKLRSGRPSKVLSWCTGCMACNNFCELDCKPYQLILDRHHRNYLEKGGLPAMIESILFYSRPNIAGEVAKRFTDREKADAEKWQRAAENPEALKGAKELLFLGCNQFLDPYVAASGLWAELPAFGQPGELCCGEPLYRLGVLDAVARQTQRLNQYFRGFEIARLVMFCPAGYNMFNNVLPQKFGLKLPFKTVYLGDWLLEKIARGEIERKQKLDMKITVHDSCHSRQLGAEFRDSNRRLLEWTGAEIVEMRRHGDQGLCCGLAAAAGFYPNTVPTLFKALAEADRTNADALAAYCNGCVVTFMIGRRFFPGKPVHHAFDLVRMAAGEEPPYLHRKRGLDLVMASLGLFRKQGLSLIAKPRRKIM